MLSLLFSYFFFYMVSCDTILIVRVRHALQIYLVFDLSSALICCDGSERLTFFLASGNTLASYWQ